MINKEHLVVYCNKTEHFTSLCVNGNVFALNKTWTPNLMQLTINKFNPYSIVVASYTAGRRLTQRPDVFWSGFSSYVARHDDNDRFGVISLVQIGTPGTKRFETNFRFLDLYDAKPWLVNVQDTLGTAEFLEDNLWSPR